MRVLYVVFAICWVDAASSHHSIAGVYDSRRQVTIDAVVREFKFINPHPLIVVEVDVASDAALRPSGNRLWTLEMDNRWELVELGFTEETLAPGDQIRVTGSLARTEPDALYVRKLEHPAADFTYEHHR